MYRWIDDQGIRRINDFYKAARKRNLVEVLREYSESTTFSNSVPSRAVIPSAKLDLSGRLNCFHAHCLIGQVEALFRRTWHYFDTLVIDGPLIDDLGSSSSSLFEGLEQRVKLLLYLRKIGAEQHLVFNRKVQSICSQHFREYAAEHDLGLDVLLDTAFEDEVVDRLSREASVRVSKNWRGWAYSVRYGDMSGLMHPLPHYDESAPPTEKEILKDTFGRYCATLISDTSAARILHLPLLQAGGTTLLNYSRSDADPMDQVAALELRLPVISNIPLVTGQV